MWAQDGMHEPGLVQGPSPTFITYYKKGENWPPNLGSTYCMRPAPEIWEPIVRILRQILKTVAG
jgi:hypothetical protein